MTDNNDNLEFDSTGNTVAGCRTDVTEVLIPGNVEGIAAGAFRECRSLEEVSVPEDVVVIEENAFDGCNQDLSIGTPDVNEELFLYEERTDDELLLCSSHAGPTVTIPARVRYINPRAFSGCTRLTHIKVEPDNQHYADIDGIVFTKDLKRLICVPAGRKSIRIPEGTKEIGEDAFSKCNYIHSVVFPNSVEHIDDAFWECNSLRNVVLPDNLKTLGDRTFIQYESLESIKFSGNSRHFDIVDEVLFSKDHKELVRLLGSKSYYSVPEGVEKIARFAFAGKDIRRVDIPDSVKTIDDDAFSFCENLEPVSIPESVSNHPCLNVQKEDGMATPDGVTYQKDESDFEEEYCLEGGIHWNKEALRLAEAYSPFLPEILKRVVAQEFNGGQPDPELEGLYQAYREDILKKSTALDFTAPVLQKQQQTGHDASLYYYHVPREGLELRGCAEDATVAKIQSEVSWIDVEAFNNSPLLSRIEVGVNDRYYSDIDGVLFADNQTILYRVPMAREEYVIPNGVFHIGDQAFRNCASISMITMPDSVRSIGRETFRNCSALTKVVLSDNLLDIGDMAFCECYSLKDISISDANSSFTVVDNVIFSKDLKNLCCYVGDGMSYHIPHGTEVLNSYSFAYSRLKDVNIPDSVKEFGSDIFHGCDSLKTIFVGANITDESLKALSKNLPKGIDIILEG